MRSHVRHLDGLTGLRAFAAAWVVAYHYALGPFRTLPMGDALPLIRGGYLGVDLFFILSGYVIWHVHGEELTEPRLPVFGRFMCLRAARLLPVYLFSTALLAGLLWWSPGFVRAPFNPEHYSARLLLLNLTLTQSWGLTRQLSWNFPAWSVSAEWFCYLLFPALALGAARTGRRGTLLGIALLVLVSASLCLTLFGGSMNQSSGGLPLLRAAPEFLLGCLLRRFAGQARLGAWPWTTLVAGSLGLWLASVVAGLPAGVLAVPCFAVLVLAAGTPGNPVAALLAAPPLIAIGAASYSLYLMQFPVEKLASGLQPWVLHAGPGLAGLCVGAYLAALAAATGVVHQAVENPSRRWLRRQIDAALPRAPAR